MTKPLEVLDFIATRELKTWLPDLAKGAMVTTKKMADYTPHQNT